MSERFKRIHDHYLQCQGCKRRHGAGFSIDGPCHLEGGEICTPSGYEAREIELTQEDMFKKAVEALIELEHGRGPYSMDHEQHAKNTIHAMKEVAKECLDELGIEREVEQDA